MFEDIVEALKRSPGEGEIVDYASLADALTEQANKLTQGFEATLSQRDNSIAEMTKATDALRAHNYQLMMKSATAEPLEPPTVNNTPDIKGIADLF